EKAINDILEDLRKDVPMNRLLEGDVGSGKTIVAAAGTFVSFTNKKRSVVMAPTQILAEQHFDTLNKVLSPFGMTISLVTSETKQFNRGSDLVVGTHALLYHEDVVKDAAFLVIDEQHRFGVNKGPKMADLVKFDLLRNTLTWTPTP